MAHPTQKRLPPSRGKLSAARLTDEGAHGNDAPLVRPLIRHLLCKCHLSPCGGKAKGRRRRRPPRGTAGTVLYPLCLAALDSIPTPFVSLRSTFPPDRGNRPSSEGTKEKSLPLTREVAFAKQMTEGETGRRGQAPPYMVCALRRGAHCAPAGGHMGPPLRRIRSTPTARRGRRALRRGYVVLLAPSSGPAGHLPPCGGKAKGRRRRRPLQVIAGAGRAHT